MSVKLYEENDIKNIADAIRDKTGTNDMYKVSEMADAINNIPLYDESSSIYFDTINVNDAPYLSSYIKKLPLINVSGKTNFESFFRGIQCSELPPIDTSGVQIWSQCFYMSKIKKFSLNTSSATNVNSIFSNCYDLEELGLLDFGKVTNVYSILGAWGNSPNLTKLGGFKDLGKAYIQRSNNYLYYTLYLDKAPNLTHDSIMNVINNLYDLNLVYTDTLYTQSLVLGSTNLAKLNEEEIAIATAKGWIVS